MTISIETGDYRIFLSSPNWSQYSDQGLLYWSSLGSREVPAEKLVGGHLDDIEDNWSAIKISEDSVALVTDLPRSRPLFYAHDGKRWLVSDSLEEIRSQVREGLDEDAAEVFELTGFALNDRTLINSVRVTEAASEVTLQDKSAKATARFWGLPLYAEPGLDDAATFAMLYKGALRNAFETLLHKTSGRQLVVPLSGGLDSRLIALILRELDAPNVLAFTYGRSGSAEAEIARSVAEELNMSFIFVPVTPRGVRDLWFAGEAEKFQDFTWSGTSLPHVQDWYALRWLQREGLVEDDAVFLPGHTPVGMMHHEDLLDSAATDTDIARALAQHHSLNKDEHTRLSGTREFHRAVRRVLSAVPSNGRRTQNVLELFNYLERQGKYINNSMRGYEFFGWSWALPLYWPEPLQVWTSGSERLTRNRDWYTELVEDIYSAATGSAAAPDYFLPPAEASKIPFRAQIVTLARKTGISRLASRLWELKVQREHPLALEGFVNADSKTKLTARLVKHRNLMRIWTQEFLRNRWGIPEHERVPARASKGAAELEDRPRLLIISYSNIERDARLRRQIDLFSRDYDVTVVGHGRPFPTEANLMLFPSADTTWSERRRAALLHAKQYALAQRLEANNLAARKLLRGRTFDAVIANDIEPVGMANDLFGPEKVHADLHEYYPGLQDNDPAWVRLRKPYYEWMLRNNAAAASSATTVSQGISTLYETKFGFPSQVVPNAAEYVDLNPTELGKPIRLVHSGAALPNRQLEEMIHAVADSAADVTLDLFLTQTGTEYYEELAALVESKGKKVQLRQPVDPSELIAVLNEYDVGLFFLPAVTTNYKMALPNKFFDFVQARLAVIVSPIKEMAQLVEEHDLGKVTGSFDRDALTEVLNAIDATDVARWKQNSALAAKRFGSPEGSAPWRYAVAQILRRSE